MDWDVRACIYGVILVASFTICTIFLSFSPTLLLTPTLVSILSEIQVFYFINLSHSHNFICFIFLHPSFVLPTPILPSLLLLILMPSLTSLQLMLHSLTLC